MTLSRQCFSKGSLCVRGSSPGKKALRALRWSIHSSRAVARSQGRVAESCQEPVYRSSGPLQL